MSRDLPFKLSQTLVGHSEDVKDALFVDPTTIISCSRDATVRIWRPIGGGESTENSIDLPPQGADDTMDTDPPQTSTETATESKAATTSSASASATDPAIATVKASAGFTDSINSNAQGFVNCLAYMKPDNEHPEGLIISAGQESLIDVRPPGYLGPDAAYLLIGHSGNVCSLDVHGTTVISGSWDQTAIVWKNWEKKYVLEGHTAAVWAVLAVSDNEFITGCADGKIRWYNGNKLYRAVQAHSQPVRGIRRLYDANDGAFISCGNDGVIKSWTKEGREIEQVYAHTAYIYSIAVLPNGQWASCGEDRTLKVWYKSQCLQTISHPCISVWCVAASSNGDLVTGASDGVLRVWSRDPERQADEETLKAYAEAIANTTIAEETTDIDKSSLPGMSALGRPGKHDGEKIHINNDGNVEAYQWSARDTTWEQVGVIASAVSSGRKIEYDGKEYDYVFDVDFEEGKPPKRLPYNASQNPWDAARTFLERNDLPMSYLETTANFIVQSTKGTVIGTSQEPQLPASADPYGIENRYRPGDGLVNSSQNAPPPAPASLLPWKTYLDIATVNFDAAVKKIIDTNIKLRGSGEKEKALNDDDLETLRVLGAFLAKPSAPTSASAKSSAAVTGGLAVLMKMITEWDGVQNVPALDLLRVLARYSPAVVLNDVDLIEVLDAIGCFETGKVGHAVFGTRVLLNSFHHAEGLKYVTQSAPEIIGKIGRAVSTSQNRLLAISADTLFLNYAVYCAKSKGGGFELALLPVLMDRVKADTDPEALYRAMVALGTLLTIGKTVVSVANGGLDAKQVVKGVVERVDKEKEKRTVDVANEIKLLLEG